VRKSSSSTLFENKHTVVSTQRSAKPNRSPNLRQSGMSWDAVGYPGRGRGIAKIAVIARNRRDRKSKTSPLINTDNSDQQLTIRGIPGIESCKSFGILDGLEGEGLVGSPESAWSRQNRNTRTERAVERVGLPPLRQEILRFAQDFACRLPLRSRLQSGSSSGSGLQKILTGEFAWIVLPAPAGILLPGQILSGLSGSG
jgi:hypothetical protein